MDYTRSITGGPVDGLEVRSGERILLQGALSRGVVLPDGSLSIQGAIADVLRVMGGGAVSFQGAIAGRLEIDEGGFALVQGVVTGEVVNRGRVVS